MGYLTLVVVIAFVLDLILGDPRWLPHPVIFIGKLISFFEKIYRKIFKDNDLGQKEAGIAMSLTVLLISGGVTLGLIVFGYYVNTILGFAIEAFLCYQILAARSLEKESMKVYKELKENGLEAGRKQVSYIVGRDTSELSEEGVIKATVETIAENTTDGEVAPLFYMCIGGATTAMMYKAVNTMDSMVGYKNDKYKNFGTFSAKLDDILNFIPARIAAVLMLISSKTNKECNFENAKKIFKRDRMKHASPNSAQTESVCAGALEIELAGPAKYFGKYHRKDKIGDKIRDIEIEDIVRANKMMYDTSFYAVISMLVIRNLILFLML